MFSEIQANETFITNEELGLSSQQPELSSTYNQVAGRLINAGKLVAINYEYSVR